MLEQISSDIKAAMIAKEKEKLDALRYLKAMLIENKTSKSPIAELDVVIKHVKKLKDSIESFPAGHEQIGKIQKEIAALASYLPKELTQDEVKAMIADIIKSNPAANQGMVMKELSPKIKGQFDGKLASELVKTALEAK